MTKEVENYEQIGQIAKEDVDILRNKGSAYGRSWIKRGGVGAFMMLARKWDRVENSARRKGYDIIAALHGEGDSLLDDIADLRRYLLLVESEYIDQRVERIKDSSERAQSLLPGQQIPAPGSTECSHCNGWNGFHHHFCPRYRAEVGYDPQEGGQVS